MNKLMIKLSVFIVLCVAVSAAQAEFRCGANYATYTLGSSKEPNGVRCVMFGLPWTTSTFFSGYYP